MTAYEIVIGPFETLADSILSTISGILLGLSDFLLYIPKWMLNLATLTIQELIAGFGNFFDAVKTLPELAISVFIDPLYNIFPSVWVVLLGVAITLNVTLRIYSFIKGIQIAGFGL